jgi:signal peptidase I
MEPHSEPPRDEQPVRAFWRKGVRPLLEALLIAFIIITFGVNTVGISGSSMHPTLHDGERAFVPKYETWLHRFGIGSFERGDIVYFRPPISVGTTPRLPVLGIPYQPFYIKRVVATSGEHVRIENGVIYVDGQPLHESYLEGTWLGSTSYPETLVPEGHVFVLGDNRGPFGSVDSRRFGPISVNAIAGRATAVIWPLLIRDETGEWHWNVRLLTVPSGSAETRNP